MIPKSPKGQELEIKYSKTLTELNAPKSMKLAGDIDDIKMNKIRGNK